MTLQSAAEQALEQLKRLHVEAGECSHPHECPVVQAIKDLELALEGLKVKPAGHESCKTCHGTGFVDFWGQLFPCNAQNEEHGVKGLNATVYPMTEVRNELADLRIADSILPETLAAIGRMRCPLPEGP